MRRNDLLIEVRDINLTRLGVVPADDVVSFTGTTLFNAVGEWTLSLAVDHWLVPSLVTPGAGIVVSDRGGELFSGPMQDFAYRSASGDNPATIEFSGVTDDVELEDRIIMPVPSNPPENQNLSHYMTTAQPSVIMHVLMQVNLGVQARAERRDNRLVSGNLFAGPSTGVTKRYRFDNLRSALAALGTEFGLGFRIIQRRIAGVERLVFETYAPTNRADTVRFSQGNHTVVSEALNIDAPTATDVVIAGQGDLTQRVVRSYTDADAQAARTLWGRRIERFVDQRQTDDETQYASRATEILTTEGRTKVTVRVIPVDDLATMTFGVDWTLGDVVGVDTAFGSYDQTVTGFVIALDTDGLRFGAQIGNPPDLPETKTLNSLVARVNLLERAK